MSKEELIRLVAIQQGCSLRSARRLIDVVVQGIETGLLQHGEMTLAGFGKFEVRARHDGLKRVHFKNSRVLQSKIRNG